MESGGRPDRHAEGSGGAGSPSLGALGLEPVSRHRALTMRRHEDSDPVYTRQYLPSARRMRSAPINSRRRVAKSAW
jgi:hypothetical protein